MKINDESNSVAGIHNCFGCGVCATVCLKKVISIRLNTEGFYEPYIEHPDGCINCGLCRQVCSYLDQDNICDNALIGAYSVWSNEQLVRNKCSSGGVAFELERKAIESGSKVCVCRYNIEETRVEHYVATTEEGLYPSVGSKYLQSLTLPGFLEIDFKDKYLVVGTPCQMDSFRRLIRLKKCEDNFTLVDFFCHGVPSLYLWIKYLRERKINMGDVSYVSWRNKISGWHDSWVICIEGMNATEGVGQWRLTNVENQINKNIISSKYSDGDAFYSLFLGNSCLGRACYEKCRFKKYSSSADIRIGDMWGNKFKSVEDGVSAVLTFTQKGNDAVKNLGRCTINTEHPDCVTEGQISRRLKKPLYRGFIIRLIKKKFIPLRLTLFISKLLSKINSIF